MMAAITSQFGASAEELPFLLLQAAAVVGIVSVLILLRRDIGLADKRFKVYYGFIFGMAGFLLALLVSEFIKLPSKPYIRSDLLFLAGLFGAWQGGLICLLIMGLARFVFGGPAFLLAGLIDMAVIAGVGVMMHGWMRSRSLMQLGLADAMIVFTVRLLASLLAVSFTYGMGMIGPDIFWSNFGRRIVSSAVTLPMIACLFLVLRSEARAREEARQREAAARTDSLTGLPNRRALKDYIEALTPVEKVESRTIVLVEIINMADVASIHGDDWGDKFWPYLAEQIVSGEVGAALKPYRPRCFLFGDATLAIVLHGPMAQDIQRTGLMTRLHAGLTAQFQIGEAGPIPHLRIGAANLDAHSPQTISSTLRNLSLALRGSDNPIQIFSGSFAEKAQSDERVRLLLVEWIKGANPPLCYQPKLEIRTRCMVGAEALLRAVDASGRPLSPYYVLEIAERHRLLVEFEWSTIEAVVRDLRELDSVEPDLHLAVNISASSFATARFGERVVTLLRDMAVPAHRLSIEVTETSKMPTIDIVQRNFDALSQAGVKLSLDDFGTGYAALTLLARFPFAEVKVDHWMTARLDQARIREAVALAFESARRYGAKLVTEGIETEEQRQLLMQMGVEFGQGYLYSSAIPFGGLVDFGSRSRTMPACA
jgi:EAL domain-containing protein (putative c-di-GMP-specific phosphodiesterase class I)/GGDEF domain-containing protein